MSYTQNIAKFAAELKYEDIPAEAVHAAKNMILDSLGCGIGTPHYNPWKADKAVKIAEFFGGREEATVLVSGKKMPAMWAGFANGLLCHGIDFDDTHKGALTHTGAPVVAACLAVSEAVGATGEEFITAVVIAYEISVRVGMAVMPSHYKYWHSTATNCTFGIAAATAKLYGCDTDGIVAALGLAGTSASGLMAYLTFGDFTKSFNPAKTVQNGIMCGAAASVGATAAERMLEDERGYCYAYSPNGPKLEKLDQELGKVYEIIGNVPKFYPCLTASHAPIEAVLTIMRENHLQKSDVANITEHTYETVTTHFSNKNPDTDMGARLSVPYCMAVAAVTGKVDMESFEEETLFNPEVREMLEHVETVADPELSPLYPEKFPAVVTIHTVDGRSFTKGVFYPKGDLNNPYTDEELQEKFVRLTTPALGVEKAKKIIELCMNLEQVPNMQSVMGCFVKS